ncbi:MAG: hypothetical protein AB1635_02205 [Acidobacteriota bacterium]
MVRPLTRALAAAAVGAFLAAPAKAADQVCLQCPTGVRDARAAATTAARQTRPDETGEVLFTVAATAGGTTLVAEGGGLTVEKTHDGQTLRVRLSYRGEVVELAAGDDEVRVSRGRRSARGSWRRDPSGLVQRVQAIALGSAALRQFDLMATHLAASDRPEALSVLTTHALVRTVVGDVTAARGLASRVRARARPAVRAAALLADGEAGPAACWDEYQRDVVRYTYEYEMCVEENRWNPVRWGACGFVYILKAELAMTWLISCSGGLPVR